MLEGGDLSENAPRPSVAGPLRARLLVSLAELAAAVRFETARLEPDGPHREHAADLCSALGTGVLAGGPEALPSGTVGAFRAYGVRCAEAGVPLDTALRAVDLAVARLLRHWWPRVGEHDLATMLPVCGRLENARKPLRRAVNDGFVSWTAMAGARAVARRSVLSAVMEGRAPDPDAVTASRLVIAPAYEVACTPGPAPADPAAGTPAVRLPAGDVLWSHEDTTLWALIPVAPGAGDADPGDVEAVLRRVWESRGPQAVAGVAPARTLAAVPAARQRAAETLRVAQASRRRGVVAHRSLAVERAVDSSPDVRAEMAKLVQRLAVHPHLVQTLRTLYDCELDRGRTAHELAIARRTLTSRLDRVEELTRVRPTSPRGVQVLLTALAAFDLDRDAS